MWPPHELTKKEKDWLITAVTSIVGHSPDFHRFEGLTGLGAGVIGFRSRLNDFINKHFQGRSEEEVRSAKGISREPTSSLEVYIDSVWSVLRRDNGNLSRDMFKGTLLELNYPYVVAGGRFDEVYYWDAYFTGEGLVLSGYLDLFDCMVRNYAIFIKNYGFIPNGNRRYYISRSQQPFFCSMVDLLVRMNGIEFVKKARIPIRGGAPIGFDLRLMSSVKDVSSVPTKGEDLVIVAAVNNVLHFRIFDGDGKVVVDTDEQRLPDQARQIEDLRKQLESLWPPHELTRSDKDRVTTAVTSIVGYPPPIGYIEMLEAEHRFWMRKNGSGNDPCRDSRRQRRSQQVLGRLLR